MTKIYSRGNRNKSIYKISKVVLIDFEQDMALYVARGDVAPLVIAQNSKMLNSLSLGTEAAGTAKISWEIFGSSDQKSL